MNPHNNNNNNNNNTTTTTRIPSREFCCKMSVLRTYCCN